MSIRLQTGTAGSYTAELLATLGKIAPELRKQAQSEVMSSAAPAIAAVQALVPAATPMSGWARGKRTRWDSASVRAGVRARRRRSGSDRNRDVIPLLSVVQTNPAGVIFDVAANPQPGKTPGRTRANQQFVQNLAAYGGRSRYMWPGVERALPAVENALRDAVRNMETTINRSM